MADGPSASVADDGPSPAPEPDGPSAIAAKGPLIAVYVRKDGYYRFEGYER